MSTIDKKRLDELNDELMHRSIEAERISFRLSEAQDIIRLARLGLWAEKHGIEALRKIKQEPIENDSDQYPEDDHTTKCGALGNIEVFVAEALAALPKEMV